MSMTSLIDVIFLLLLFFMLSSTFTRFAEVELSAAGSASGASLDRPVFLSLGADRLRLNATDASLKDLSDALARHRSGEAPLAILVSLQRNVTAQRLTDLLAALRSLPNLNVTVLETT